VLARENEREFARLGLAVGKKRIRNAVGRNRIKRLARESFRHHGEVLAGLDVVVLCRFDGAATNEELRRSLAEHWRRLAPRRP
jgi:ribonuclease P protein component